jgi:cysteine-rich repeat protein
MGTRFSRGSAVILIGALVAAGCFHPAYDHPTCGSGGQCPGGMICDSQGSCELLPDTCQEFGLHCPAAKICAADQAICIDTGGCGDGIVEPGEACDDGNLVDGMTSDAGVFTLDECSHDCTLIQDPLCGNRLVDPDRGEDCDPGPVDALDCNSNRAGANSCRAPRCGDGYANLAAGEKCDSGGMDSAQCNGRICTFPICGDNYLNQAAGEQCESDGKDTQVCNGITAGALACQAPSCGDGYLNAAFTPSGSAAPEECDNAGGGDTTTCNGNNHGDNGPGSCRHPSCGDGYANSQTGEQCDPLGGDDSSSCNGKNAGAASCKKVVCGDGHVNVAAGETCDTPGGVDSVTCNGSAAGIVACHAPRCGDGYKNIQDGEGCDNGDADTLMCNGSIGSPTSRRCQPVVCGDKYVNAAAEDCDPGTSADSTTCNGNGAGAFSCKFPRCGDGYINSAAGEECEKNTDCPAPKTCSSCKCS